MDGLPKGVHSWAQSDRYSVASQFVDDLDFFEPKTHSLTSEEGRVGVEFPIVQFISAAFSKPFGGKSILPFVYRFLTGLVMALGIYRLVNVFQIPEKLKIFSALFCLSPLALYYQFNFLPDAASFGLLCFGLSYVISFRRKSKTHLMLLAFAFLALASLVKTSSGVYFIALMGTIVLWPKSQLSYVRKAQIIGWAIGLSCIVIAYDYFYFYEVNKSYWSVIFMSKTQPLASWVDFASVWKNVRVWLGDYFSTSQYILMIGVVYTLIVRRKSIKGMPRNPLTLFAFISLLGVIAFSVLFGNQFSNHDYYFLCTFYPLFIWILVNTIALSWGKGWLYQGLYYPILLFLSFYHLAEINSSAKARFSEHYPISHRVIDNETKWMTNGAEFLDEFDPNREKRILVLYEFGPNTCLVHFDRKGKVFNHEEMNRDTKDHLEYWKERIDPSYFIIRKQWSSHLEEDYSKWLEDARLVIQESDFSIYEFKAQ